ncbi:polyhydroxyalkanoate synthesis repressor PhaR [Erythrobacter sp. THAF29]|uniref:polyhydroxyalkanoate synthesis repressor PhaR n=1 Tax=Erythrobacter sp. THAF29 TaxID=2587851 RepID=UPI0012684AF7|nr:polyhydroxyalkanoate synthesis repressor PhaR [Erythrobacter sp. THAF29]QFT77902.1 PHB/PHA accumulation regulator DNA-binding domain protein [Erythrobacter sp. THAF29]
MARKSDTASASEAGDTIIIKKYANRRLYNTSSSSYITLDDLAKMVRENVEFVVIDAKSGDDITHSILTQIIMDEEAHGEQMLPVSFLRQLIGMYGNSMQSLMPSYLEASMANFRQNQSKIREAFEKGMSAGPLAAIHETNMAMMRAAAETFIPGQRKKPPEPTAEKSSQAEIEALREQMAVMQKKLDDLSK